MHPHQRLPVFYDREETGHLQNAQKGKQVSQIQWITSCLESPSLDRIGAKPSTQNLAQKAFEAQALQDEASSSESEALPLGYSP
jgi:hypothetical protein